jgi:uncharacterized protein YjdB
MKKFYLCLLLCLLSASSFALNGPSTPGGVGTGYSGITTYCVGAAASPITYNYSECSVGVPPTPATGVNCIATWYYNTTNTTVISGATVTVSGPTAFTSAAGTNGDLPPFTPVTTTAGTYYYFCVVTWTDPGTCTSPFVTGTRSVTINPNPAAIAGSSSVCANSTIALSSATSGGAWSSSSLPNATVAASGVVTGVSFGTANISYTLPATGCYAIKTVTVDSLPTPITGSTVLCMTTTTTLSSGSGGTWSSSNGLVATVDPSGVVTSVSVGTTLIDYTLSTGCSRSAVVTVNTTPAIISGASTVCTGLTTTLTNSNAGGTWSSSNTAVATISSGGVVTAGTAGTTNIIYTLPTGCSRTMTMTVNQTPAAITGTLAICSGSTSTLSNATAGGLWSTSNPGVASIDFSTGVVTAGTVGTATISYIMPTGCKTVIAATVNTQPGAITGTTSICLGAISTLGNSVSGGVWSSSTGSVATIGTSTGVVTSLLVGTTTISYQLANGCNSSTIVTVNSLPGAITGVAPICSGGTVTLSNSVGSGTWSSSAPGIAAVGSSSGIVTGGSAGTATITYTLSTGCKATAVETVSVTPAVITGTMVLCQNQTVTLASATAGGTWSSSTTAVATITAAGVVVPGATAGTTDITYMMPSGCYRATVVTVNATPAAISGSNTVCVGSTISLTNSLAGGIWSSSNTAFASVTSGTGVVTGVSASAAVTISYTMGTGCRATLPVTVYATPAAITGNISICMGAISTLADVTAGGTWSSSNTGVATIGVGTGVVSSVSVGTSVITYMLGSGCYTTIAVSINTMPGASTGTPVVCVGGTTTLSNATVGGTFTSSNTAIATVVGATGVVTGAAAGTALISYSMSTGCRVTTVVTVNSLPTVITGGSSVCVGSSISLSSTPAGGTWSSSTTDASVGLSTGVVTGNTAGSTTITYTLGTTCYRTTNVTVQPLPAAIGGTLSVCVGSTTSLNDATVGGTWASSNPGVASIGVSSGVVTGGAFGTATITYTLATGCKAFDIVTVNSLPANITGTTNVCVGSTITLANATGSGTWGSSTGNATIDAAGVVTGVSAGTSVISYMLSTGCYKTLTVTVNALPAPIGGALAICMGSTGVLTDATAGGTWSSSTTGVATIVASSGVATGVTAGTSTITYRVTATGCVDTAILTVNALPAAITGTPSVCFGLTTTLGSTPAGGTWSSSASGIAAVDAAGVVTGAGVGTARITYTLATSCYTTQLVTVNTLPTTFGGSLSVCVGSTTALTSSPAGGTWSSSTTAVGTIGSTTGILGGVGVAGGNTDITYTLSTGCIRTATATVNPLPTAISGTMAICFGNNTTLSSTPATGTWASSNAAVASIDAAGVITTGTASGTSIITYTVGTGCRTTSILTVNPLPNAITGGLSVCTGLTTTLATTTPGGTWSSSNTAAATVSSTGVVFGVGAGTTIIDYTLASGCYRSVIVTVNQSPAAITGTAAVCLGLTTTLANSIGSGVWSSSNVTVAPIDAAGVVTGSVAGTSMITYALGTCIATKVVTVNSLPTAISGTLVVCEGLTTTLTSSPAGGTWMSSVPANATVGTSGVVTGVLAGTSAITYTLATGCLRSAVVNVLAAPTPITGTTALCATFTTTLANTVSGGAWNSSNPVVATVNSSGVVTGVAAGNAVITYTLPTGCSKIQGVTVNAVPSVIAGTPVICENGTTNLSSTPAGGVWSSSIPAVAIVSGAGTVIGVSAGTTIIDYTLASGCFRSVTVTVNPAPSVITGATTICTGATSTLSSFPTGGVWSSSNASLASVDAAGVVSGVSAGFVNITYTLGSGCTRVAPMTVNATPSNIAGVPFLCQGTTTSLTSTPAGGTWDSDVPSVAIVSTTGTLVTAGSPGTTTVSYTLTNGCYRTVVVTVSPVPAAISGPTSLCVASSATFSNTTPGGNWTSANAAIASVGFTSGVVNGVAQGVTNITYSLTSGCRAIQAISINPLPAVITGLSVICVGNTTTLGNTTGGGSWSSSDMGVATIGSGTGAMTGLLPGTSTISYTLTSTGCARTSIITVSALPAAITGSVNVCVGTSSLLSNLTTGGSWTSSNIAIASIGSTTGLLVGNNPGVATVTYALSSGCYTTTPVTVNPLPAPIAGGLNVCVGSTSVLSTSTSGGTWLSGNPSVADVDAGGVVTGYSTGIAPISYTIGTGCSRVVYVTVNPLPSPIVGLHGICISSSTTLTNATSGGQWTSSNTAVANIGLTNGVVTPASSGTTLISYTLTTGCRDTFTLNVHPLPSAITGPTVMCVGSSATLTNAMTGGTWSSSSSVVASVGSSSGIVTGNSTGIAGITYSLGTGCRTTTVVTINTIPAAITGVASVCEGSATILNNVTPGGVWSTENPTIATISPTGIVGGVAPNTVIISYTLSSGCARTIVVTVNPTPPAISGASTMCIGACTTFSNDSTGGVWNSSNPTVASVGISTGVVCGLTGGTALITYTLGTGCQAEYLVTVNTVPPAITGVASVCQGLTTTLSNSVMGGTWVSQDPAVANVGYTTGIVTGLLPGQDTIFYQLVGGCTSYIVVTVNATPLTPTWAGTGAPNVCVGDAITMGSIPSSGTWASSNLSVATIGLSSGILSGLTPGTTSVTYTLGTGCQSMVDVIVNPMPSPITGIDHVCSGLTTTFYNSVPGGVWSTDNPSVASIDASTGAISGGATGFATITYALAPSCSVTKMVTVDATPAIIGGFLEVCAGSATTLTNTTPDGLWSSTNPAIAPIGLTTGIVTGVSVGTATISYTLLGTGCASTAVMTVNAVPATITGSATVCEAGTTTLSSTTIAGVWTVDNPLVAVVGSGTGVVTGLDSGSTVVTYQIPTTGCYTTKTIAINPLPAPIAGASVVCEASTTTLTNTTPFGTWSSSNTLVATAGSTSGSVAGVSAGTTTITYLLGTGCYVTQQFTVDPVPAALTGVPHVCVGTTTYLASATAGGVWASSNTAVGTVAAGNVTGIAPGTTGITYTLATGCAASVIVTVEPTPTPITGTLTVCEGSSTTLGSTPFGGTWTSGTPSVATIDPATGLVNAITAGTSLMTYATPVAGCYVTATVSVDPLPSAIAGIGTVCEGSLITLSNLSSGGSWSSDNVTVATIGSTGIVSGVAQGTATISYTMTSGCAATGIVTVNPLPHAGTITGSASVCKNASMTLVSTVIDGKWYSKDTTVLTIDSLSGVLTGVDSGSTNVVYVYTNMCGTDTATQTIVVNPLPNAGVITGSAATCIGYTTTLSSSVAGGVWSSSNPAIATVSSAGVVSGIAPGTVLIRYLLTTICGTDTVAQAVTIHGLAPHTPITIHPDTTMCSNVLYQNFGASAAPTTGYSFAWSAINAEIYATNADRQFALVSFHTPGTAMVILTTHVLSSGCSMVDSFIATIGTTEALSPEVRYYNSELICMENTADSYQWGYDDATTLDSTLIPGQIHQDYYLPVPDFAHKLYWVMMVKNGCMSKTYYNSPTSVNSSVVADLDIRIFPNPANSLVNILVSGVNSYDKVDARLIDMTGKDVYMGTFDGGKGSINVSELPSGVYSVMLSKDGVKIGARTFVKN